MAVFSPPDQNFEILIFGRQLTLVELQDLPVPPLPLQGSHRISGYAGTALQPSPDFLRKHSYVSIPDSRRRLTQFWSDLDLQRC